MVPRQKWNITAALFTPGYISDVAADGFGRELFRAGMVVNSQVCTRQYCRAETKLYETCFRLRGESGFVQRSIQPVAAAVAREHATGAIGSVSSRSKTDDQERR